MGMTKKPEPSQLNVPPAGRGLRAGQECLERGQEVAQGQMLERADPISLIRNGMLKLKGNGKI